MRWGRDRELGRVVWKSTEKTKRKERGTDGRRIARAKNSQKSSLAEAADESHHPGVVVQLPHRRVLLLRTGAEVVLGDQLVPYLLVVLLQDLPQSRHLSNCPAENILSRRRVCVGVRGRCLAARGGGGVGEGGFSLRRVCYPARQNRYRAQQKYGFG